MQSNNGDLYFRAGIDIDGFNAGASAMEQRMKSLTSTVVNDSGRMDDALSSIGDTFTRIVGIGAAGGFIKEMFNVRSEMQNTEAMLKVFLGSAEKADKFFKELQGYAYNNVFEFKDLAQQSAQLLAYKTDVEDVIPTLNKLSEIAASTSAPLDELVTVFNKVKATNKLDSDAIYSLGGKGINVRETIAEITELETGQKLLAEEVDVTGLKFKDLEKIIEHMAGEGGKYSGMMEEKMKTLGDTLGLMQDNITNMFNELGEENEGLLKSGMDVGNYLIENYREVAKVLGTLVVAYGSAKAARIALNIAQKNGTGITVLDNTAWGIRASLMKKEITNNTAVTKSIRDIKKAQEEEIATLRQIITEQEHEAIIRKSRVANLDEILSSQQKAKLAQMGLTEASEDYIPIATSMLDKEQLISMNKAELTNNSQSYIDAMKEVVGISTDEIKTMDERIQATAKELSLTEELLESAQKKKEILEEKVAEYKESYETILENASASEVQAKAEALEEAQTKLQSASKNVESLAETRNTLQKKLNEVQTRKSTLATTSDTVATNINTKAKNLSSIAIGKLTSGLKMLWAVMKANPIMSVVSIVTTLYSVITSLTSKTEEAEEATMGLGKASKEASKTFEEEKSKIDVLTGFVNDNNLSLETRKKKLAELKEIVPDYHADLTNEGLLINDNTEAIDNYCKALEKQIRLQSYEKELVELTRKKIEAQENVKIKEGEVKEKEAQRKLNSEITYYGYGGAMIKTSDNIEVGLAQKDLAEAQEELSKIEDEIKKIKAEIESDEAIKKEEEKTEKVLTVAEKQKQLLSEIAKTEKALKEARSSSSAYDKDEIERLENTLKNKQAELKALTGVDSKKDIKSKKELIEAELQLEIEKQEAIIATMTDGIEKQQAILELNYKKQLSSIDKARKDYIKQCKEAGKKESSEQMGIFSLQESNAEKELDDNKRKLFEKEIEEHKQAYEEYNKWVNAVSLEAANKKFSNLIEEGKNFEDWVNRQISRLESQAERSKSERDFLDNLKGEKERNNSMSYKTFFEELETEIDKAPTLAKKLELLSNAIEKLQGNGDSSNAKNDLLLNLAQMVIDTQEEIDNTFNEKYKTYAQKRVELEQSYLADIKRLADKGMDLEAGNLSRELKNAIETLNIDFVKSLVASGLEKPTKENIKKSLETLRSIEAMTLEEFNSGYSTELTEEGLQNIKKAIGDVKLEIKKLGEGYTLADAFREIKDGKIEGNLEKISRGTEFLESSFSKFTNVISLLNSALSDLADITDNENLKNTAKTVSSISDVISSTSSWASAGASIGGGWGALVGAILGAGVGFLGEYFESEAERKEEQVRRNEEGLEYQKNIASSLVSILDSVEGLTNAVTSLSYNQYKDSLVNLIEELKAGSKTMNGSGESYWNYIDNAIQGADKTAAQVLSTLVEQGVISQKEADDRTRENRINSGGTTSIINEEGLRHSIANYLNWSMNEFAKENERLISELQDLYNANSFDSLEYFNKTAEVYQLQLRELEFQKGIMEALGQDTTEIEKEIAELEHAMTTSLQTMAESLYGIDIESIISDWISIFEEFGSNVEGAFNAIDKGIDNMISNMIRQRLVIEPLMEQLTSIFDEYQKEVGDDHEYTNDDFLELANRIGDAKSEAYDAYQNYLNFLDELGINLTDIADPSTLAGSIQNLSEETGGVIAGRLNAMVINLAEGNNYLRQSLLVQYETRDYMSLIHKNVETIKNRMDSSAPYFNDNMNYGISDK